MQRHKSDMLAKMLKLIIAVMICGFTALPAFGQMGASFYSVVWTDESGDVYGFGVTDSSYNQYNHQSRAIVSLSSPNGRVSSYDTGYSGSSATGYVYLLYDENDVGSYFINTEHWDYCPVVFSDIYQGSSTQTTQTCTDTCTQCRTQRHNQTILAYTALAVCEATALTVLNNGLAACDLQNFCKPEHQDYNPELCASCKNNHYENYAIAQAACAAAFAGLMLTRPDCGDGTRQNKQCAFICSND